VRILVYGLNFAPELTGIGKFTGEMTEWLHRRGYDIRVVTAPPYYPQWSVQPGYSQFAYRSESAGSLNGAGEGARQIKIRRCPLWVPRHPKTMARMVHLASFAASSFPVVVGQARWRPDVVWTVMPASFSLPGAIAAARLAGAKLWLHVQDFEVDAAFELGLLRARAAQALVRRVESAMLAQCDRVSSISEKMVERLGEKGVAAEKRILFPNWVDLSEIRPLDRMTTLRAELGIAADKVVVLYSGNLGEKQGLEILLEAAQKLAGRTDLCFVIAGSGAVRDQVVSAAKSLPNVIVIPLQPLQRLNELLNTGDIHVVPQRAGAADLVMPSKLTGILAAGKPAVATAAPGTAVHEALEECGLSVPPGDVAAFCVAIERLADDTALRQRLGANARRYAEEHCGKTQILSRFEMELLRLCPSG
jgi:colanic acid biosynthesis glycosyl transferase WcaI